MKGADIAKIGKGGGWGMVFESGLVGRFGVGSCLVGCFGLEYEGSDALVLLFWSRERARSGSMLVVRGMVVESVVAAGWPLPGCSCAGAALLFDIRESAKLGSMVAVRWICFFLSFCRCSGGDPCGCCCAFFDVCWWHRSVGYSQCCQSEFVT